MDQLQNHSDHHLKDSPKHHSAQLDRATLLAEKILNDEMLLRQLSDRVYQLLRDEIQYQSDRNPTWSRRL